MLSDCDLRHSDLDRLGNLAIGEISCFGQLILGCRHHLLLNIARRGFGICTRCYTCAVLVETLCRILRCDSTDGWCVHGRHHGFLARDGLTCLCHLLAHFLLVWRGMLWFFIIMNTLFFEHRRTLFVQAKKNQRNFFFVLVLVLVSDNQVHALSLYFPSIQKKQIYNVFRVLFV